MIIVQLTGPAGGDHRALARALYDHLAGCWHAVLIDDQHHNSNPERRISKCDYFITVHDRTAIILEDKPCTSAT